MASATPSTSPRNAVLAPSDPTKTGRSGKIISEPTSVKIYNTARAAPTPALNALATLLLVAAMLAVALGFLLYRWLGKRGGQTESIGSFAGET